MSECKKLVSLLISDFFSFCFCRFVFFFSLVYFFFVVFFFTSSGGGGCGLFIGAGVPLGGGGITERWQWAGGSLVMLPGKKRKKLVGSSSFHLPLHPSSCRPGVTRWWFRGFEAGTPVAFKSVLCRVGQARNRPTALTLKRTCPDTEKPGK